MISVVIPAYNEEKAIRGCLEALTKQEWKEPFEVIVVDNASTDATAEIARSFSPRLDVRVVREERKGRGAARAAGFAAASGDIILSTDADCAVPPDWMQALVTTLRSNLTIAAVTTPCMFTGVFGMKRKILNLQWLLMWAYRLFRGSFWLNGFSFAIRRNTYDAAGGFDPRTDAQEDTDLARRVRRVGRIHLLLHPRVQTSGRRFSTDGLLKGLWSYLSTFIAVHVFRDGRRHELSDVR